MYSVQRLELHSSSGKKILWQLQMSFWIFGFFFPHNTFLTVIAMKIYPIWFEIEPNNAWFYPENVGSNSDHWNQCSDIICWNCKSQKCISKQKYRKYYSKVFNWKDDMMSFSLWNSSYWLFWNLMQCKYEVDPFSVEIPNGKSLLNQ